MEGEIPGRWIKNADLAPETNVYGRRWRDKNGNAGTYPAHEPWRVGACRGSLEWFFPDTPTA